MILKIRLRNNHLINSQLNKKTQNILITGYESYDKGSQARLEALLDLLNANFKNHSVFLAVYDRFDVKKYDVTPIYIGEQEMKIIMNLEAPIQYISALTRDIVSIIKGKPHNFMKYNQLRAQLSNMDLILDISEHRLTDSKDPQSQYKYLYTYHMADICNIKYIIMPQSFGPFKKYPTDYKKSLLKDITEYLNKAEVVFTRDTESYNALSRLGIKKLKKSADIVFLTQSTTRKNPVKVKAPEINTTRNVLVLPSKEQTEEMNIEKILKLYREMIRDVLNRGHDVYIAKYKHKDAAICKEITKLFNDNKRVHYIKDDLTFESLDAILSNFDFCIVSDYYQIVQSFCKNIPCLLVRNTIDNHELMKRFGQAKHILDISSNKVWGLDVISAIEKLNRTLIDDKARIASTLNTIQSSKDLEILKQYIH